MAIWASAGPEVAVRRQACLAALRIVAELGRRAAAGERVALPTRIGLHSGEIWLGEIGAGQHLEYRAVGDIVNTASRIEGLNKRLGTRILASAETLQGLEGFRCRELGAFTLAGKTKPVVIHELIGAGDASDPADAEFANALMQFRAERWQEAAALFRRCGGGGAPDGPARFYVELCDEALRSGRSRLENGAVRIAEK
jgi:adenylate cyclase